MDTEINVNKILINYNILPHFKIRTKYIKFLAHTYKSVFMGTGLTLLYSGYFFIITKLINIGGYFSLLCIFKYFLFKYS